MTSGDKTQGKNPQGNKDDAKSQSAERQKARENQPGRGIGEGTSGMQRGDGHPNGR